MKDGMPFLSDDRFRSITGWLVILGTSAFSVSFLAFLIFYSWHGDSWLVDVVKQHFQATVGLPLSAIAAMCIVFIFKFVSGNIEFEALTFKFKGASGPVVLWTLCFLAMAGAIKMLW